MPKITVWVRNEDWETWTNIRNVPETLHAFLQALKKKQEETRLKEEPRVEPV